MYFWSLKEANMQEIKGVDVKFKVQDDGVITSNYYFEIPGKLGAITVTNSGLGDGYTYTPHGKDGKLDIANKNEDGEAVYHKSNGTATYFFDNKDGSRVEIVAKCSGKHEHPTSFQSYRLIGKDGSVMEEVRMVDVANGIGTAHTMLSPSEEAILESEKTTAENGQAKEKARADKAEADKAVETERANKAEADKATETERANKAEADKTAAEEKLTVSEEARAKAEGERDNLQTELESVKVESQRQIAEALGRAEAAEKKVADIAGMKTTYKEDGSVEIEGKNGGKLIITPDGKYQSVAWADCDFLTKDGKLAATHYEYNSIPTTDIPTSDGKLVVVQKTELGTRIFKTDLEKREEHFGGVFYGTDGKIYDEYKGKNGKISWALRVQEAGGREGNPANTLRANSENGSNAKPETQAKKPEAERA